MVNISPFSFSIIEKQELMDSGARKKNIGGKKIDK